MDVWVDNVDNVLCRERDGCTREEWLTMLCGLTLGLVLQVLVAAWFALVQVKNRRERS
jgi:hypothetical protein